MVYSSGGESMFSLIASLNCVMNDDTSATRLWIFHEPLSYLMQYHSHFVIEFGDVF